jgi:hypothetical protein
MDTQETTQKLIVKDIKNAFLTQCVCNFSSEAHYYIFIDTKLIDDSDLYWNTTASERLRVNVAPQPIQHRLSFV